MKSAEKIPLHDTDIYKGQTLIFFDWIEAETTYVRLLRLILN